MTISKITKEQVKSIVTNSLIAGVVAFVGVWATTSQPYSKTALIAGAMAAGMAVAKTIQKAFTEG